MRLLSARTLLILAAALACAIGLLVWRLLPTGEDDPIAKGPPWYEDVTDKVGLDFVHDPGAIDTYAMPQSMGSGCAFLDFDGDGLLDLYLLHHGGPTGKKNQLFKQLPDHTFRDVSAGSGLDFAGLCTGVAVGDVNNDGRPDVVVTMYGGAKIFVNRGDGRFEDATAGSGLANPMWGMSTALFDFDRDGWLDLVIVNYLAYDPDRRCTSPQGLRDFCGPNQFPGSISKLFRNRGKGPKGWAGFEDVSLASGIGKLAGPGLGVAVADFDGDGWPDLFVANDGQPNRLWINQKNGTFVDEAVSSCVAYNAMGRAYAGMGVAVGDVTGSGMLDIFVTHLGTETNTLWRQGPRGQFRDLTFGAGLAAPRWRGTGFGTLLADFDLDGALDLAIVNGRVARGGPAKDSRLGFWETYAEHNQLFANDGAGKFRDISTDNPAFSGPWNVGRGLACADYDNDGAPDLLVSAIGSRARLYRNVAPNRGHWLQVRALDKQSQRDALGAEIRVKGGGKEWLRLINPAESYLSSNSPLALFGLGKTSQFDAIHVAWPDGAREVFPGGGADRLVTLRQGEGRAP